jgi:hypothetical protein
MLLSSPNMMMHSRADYGEQRMRAITRLYFGGGGSDQIKQ